MSNTPDREAEILTKVGKIQVRITRLEERKRELLAQLDEDPGGPEDELL